MKNENAMLPGNCLAFSFDLIAELGAAGRLGGNLTGIRGISRCDRPLG